MLGKKEIPMVVAFVAAPSGAKPVADKVDPSQLPPGDVATIHCLPSTSSQLAGESCAPLSALFFSSCLSTILISQI